MTSKPCLVAACLGVALVSSSCSDGEDVSTTGATAPFQELYDQGIDRYLGAFTPQSSERGDDGVVTHTFGEGDGPLCYTGRPYWMSTRDGTSDELQIFLQGGGACGPTSCRAVDIGLPLFNFGILSADDTANPAFGFNLAYVPYCDGTLFTGDRDVDSDGDGLNDRFFRGLQNLSASLDIIVNTYPAPSRILLAGNSAGGFGVHYALPLVRKLYPEVPIELVNDSGVGIMSPGAQNSLNEYWNSGAFFPESCATCIGEDGHLTDYHKYQLAEDENVRMGFISSTEDEVVFAGLTLDGTTPAAELFRATAELEEAHPERFRSLIPDNQEHTFLIKQFGFPVGGTTVQQWVADMLAGDESWVSVSE